MIKNFFPLMLIAVFSLCLFPCSTKALSATVHIPEKYVEVEAGERLYFELEILYPENPVRKDLRLEYDITKDGNMIASSEFLKAVETQASFMDYVVIPDSASAGLYKINVHIRDYDFLDETAADTFSVIVQNSQTRTYFYIILGTIILLGLVVGLEIYKLEKVIKKKI